MEIQMIIHMFLITTSKQVIKTTCECSILLCEMGRISIQICHLEFLKA